MKTNSELQKMLPDGWRVRDGNALAADVVVKHATRGQDNVSLVVTPRDNAEKNVSAFVELVEQVERAST